MRDETTYDVVKIWLFAASCILGAAIFSPFVWNGGLALAEITAQKDTNAIMRRLSEFFHKASFTDVFQCTLGAMVLLGLLPLLDVLRGRPRVGYGQFVVKNDALFRQFMLGFVGACGLLAVLGIGMILTGRWQWHVGFHLSVHFWFWTLTIACLSALIQEGFFRGMAMGVFLRAMRPASAWGMTTAFFAFCHFMVTRPSGCQMEADGFGIGLEWLGKRITDFSDGTILLKEFFPTLLLGGLLSYARWRTASLALPLGIHAGWLFASALHAQGIIEKPSNFPWLGYAAMALTCAMLLDFLPVKKPAYAVAKT